MNFLVHDHSGRILRTGYCPPSMMALQMGIYEFVVEGQANDLTQWVNPDTWQVEDRPTMALTIQGTTISGIPAGASLTVEGQNFIVEDGVAELEFDFPGTYAVRIECFPYMDTTVEVTA